MMYKNFARHFSRVFALCSHNFFFSEKKKQKLCVESKAKLLTCFTCNFVRLAPLAYKGNPFGLTNVPSPVAICREVPINKLFAAPVHVTFTLSPAAKKIIMSTGNRI